jgi:hypothetical protein
LLTNSETVVDSNVRIAAARLCASGEIEQCLTRREKELISFLAAEFSNLRSLYRLTHLYGRAVLYPATRTRRIADPNRMTLSYHVIVKFKHSWPAAFAVGYSKTFPASDNLSGGSGLRGVNAASECMTAAVTVDRSSTDW